MVALRGGGEKLIEGVTLTHTHPNRVVLNQVEKSILTNNTNDSYDYCTLTKCNVGD